MSQHPSLRSKEKGAEHRSVHKRHERIKELKEKEKWKEGDSVFGLPKLKILKFKVKKEKAVPAAAEAAGAPAGETLAAKAAPQGQETAKAAPKTAGKEAATKKEVTPKKEEKKK